MILPSCWSLGHKKGVQGVLNSSGHHRRDSMITFSLAESRIARLLVAWWLRLLPKKGKTSYFKPLKAKTKVSSSIFFLTSFVQDFFSCNFRLFGFRDLDSAWTKNGCAERNHLNLGSNVLYQLRKEQQHWLHKAKQYPSFPFCEEKFCNEFSSTTFQWIESKEMPTKTLEASLMIDRIINLPNSIELQVPQVMYMNAHNLPVVLHIQSTPAWVKETSVLRPCHPSIYPNIYCHINGYILWSVWNDYVNQNRWFCHK
jgi:hypothetical protein